MARRADAKEKPRLGRPPKSGGAKRAHFTFRVDDDLKDWLTEFRQPVEMVGKRRNRLVASPLPRPGRGGRRAVRLARRSRLVRGGWIDASPRRQASNG